MKGAELSLGHSSWERATLLVSPFCTLCPRQEGLGGQLPPGQGWQAGTGDHWFLTASTPLSARSSRLLALL